MLNKRQALIGYVTYAVLRRVIASQIRKQVPVAAASRRRWWLGIPLLGALLAAAAVVFAKLRRKGPPAEN
jgi:hypothetical protein